jgi:hypothetical protein
MCEKYLNERGDNTVVCSVGEKTSMEAEAPIKPTTPSRPVHVGQREFEYRRHRTASLFAADDVHTRQVVRGQPTAANRMIDFIGFPEHRVQVINDRPSIYLVPNHGSPHVAQETIQRRDAPVCRGRFVVRDNPTNASWLNKIQLFWCRIIRRGELHFVAEQITKIMIFIDDCNLTTQLPMTTPAAPSKSPKHHDHTRTTSLE